VKPVSILAYFQLIPNLLSRPTASDDRTLVFNPRTVGVTVTLYYNCAYMNNVCQNYENFRSTARGINPHPLSVLGYDVYGFDFNTTRKDRRRAIMCPSSWKNNPSNRCPATGSIHPFRSSQMWWTADLEPGTLVNQIANQRGPGGQLIKNSGIRYTCDEFPPATWVEGGGGRYLISKGTTRCAVGRCAIGINAEQDCTQSQVFLNSNDCC
jgi:hypothetical protein